MSLARYGLLRGQVFGYQIGSDANPHFQIIVKNSASDDRYRIAVNVRSQDKSEVLYYLRDPFQHELIDRLPQQSTSGFNALHSTPDSLALDYIRGNLFDPAAMRPLGMAQPASDALNGHLEYYVKLAQNLPGAEIYAFGQIFDDGDRDFWNRGIHDIHMNQGNPPPYDHDNGIYQDGGLLLYYPATGSGKSNWVACFLAFETQSFHTTDSGGFIAPSWADQHGGAVYEPSVAIVSALPQPTGKQRPAVTLLNQCASPVDLAGWRVTNRVQQQHALSGQVAAGEHRPVALPQGFLNPGGDNITLVDRGGRKVHGVSFPSRRAQPGHTVLFPG